MLVLDCQCHSCFDTLTLHNGFSLFLVAIVVATRYATLPNIMKAKKKPITSLTPKDLAVSVEQPLETLQVRGHASSGPTELP
jgi:hypothetical protein